MQVVDARGQVVAASANVHGDARIGTVEPAPDGYAAWSVDRLAAGDGPFRVVARGVTTRRGPTRSTSPAASKASPTAPTAWCGCC